MNCQPSYNNITTCLPPQFEQLSSFEFGKLIIQLNIEQLEQLNISRFQFEFMGAKSTLFECKISRKTFEFPIRTTLWHFYQYLKDMDFIKLVLQTRDESQCLICTKKLQLFPTSKVMNKNYLKGNYIANSVELCDIFCQNKSNKGYVMFKVKLQFDQQIHQKVKDVVNFEVIMNNPEENNEPKEKFVQPKQSLLINSKQVRGQNTYQNMRDLENISSVANVNVQNQTPIQYSEVKHLEEDQSRIIEDDIDRLIAQMQNKPYDSSRYLDNLSSTNFNQVPQNNFINTQSIPFSGSNQNSFHSINSIPVDSRMNRFQQQQLNQTYQQQSNRNQHNNSRSPHANKKYPPIPLPNNRNPNQLQQFIGNQTIYSQNQRSLSPMNSRKRSLNRTQRAPFQNNQSMRNISYTQNSMSMTGSLANPMNQSNKGTLKIQLHQLLGRELQVNDCILRVFVNNEYEDIMNCKGYQQGEVIVYNQKAQLNQCQLCDVQKLRFELQNWQGQVLYSSIFQMNRLINIPKLQGIFMLNLVPHNQQFYGARVTASQTVLKQLSNPPSQLSLRITISFTQQIQVIQMYMNMSKFSLNFSKCKYKLPFTKQTVVFQPTQAHFNIFPHSKAYTKLMIEFWDDKAIIGVSQVNLSNLKNITKNVLECNLQPIYLYDTVFPIKNIFNQNQVGKFKLLVCCGNVRQVQHVLNKSMLNRSMSMTQMTSSNLSTKTPVQVEYDKKLGVFIKDRKTNQEIQIQVDAKQLQNNHNLDQKQSLFNKKQDYHEISMLSQNQFLANQQNDNKADISLSKVHSIKLSQQEINDDQDDQQGEVQKPSSQFNKKKSSNVEPQQKKVKQTNKLSKQLPKQPPSPPPKPLKSLESIICTNLKHSFNPLLQNNFQPYQQLKKSCKPHLLFNFIDIDILIKQMMQIGISKFSITQILQILQPLNGMVNFNLLNDFMMCLEVEGEVKYNLIPNKLFVRLALEEFYRLSCEQIQKQQQQYNPNNQSDQKQWLSSRYLQQIPTLDQSIDFNQTKKLFTLVGVKISMSEYTLLKNFLQNQKEIRSFLFQMAQTKSSYQQMVKSQKNLFEVLKLCIIEELINKKKQFSLNKKYEQSILDKLYSSKMFEQSLAGSKLSQNYDNNQSSLYHSRASEIDEDKAEFVETKKNYPSKNTQQQTSFVKNNNDSLMFNKNTYPQHNQDDDDFIIMGLNAKDQSKDVKKQSPKQQTINNFTKRHQYQSHDDDVEPQIVNSKKFKQPAPQISFSNTGQTVINYGSKRTITLHGLQDCRTTCQCQLDMELQSPFFKVLIESPYQKKLYFKQSDSSTSQQFDVRSGDANDDQEIEGTVLLIDVTHKGELQIAAARFVVIKGIQSVYALKTIQEETFCGLVKITIE